MNSNKTYLSVSESAKLIGVHPETLRRYVREKKLTPDLRVGGRKEMRFDKVKLLDQFKI